MLSEISQTQKDKYCMISLICGIFLKSRIHRSRGQNGGCQELGRWGEWGDVSQRVQSTKFISR